MFSRLCRSGPNTLNELQVDLPRLQRFTIETLLLRLAEKGYVSAREGTTDRFRALVPFDEALEKQIDRFIETFIGDDREACAQLIRQAEQHWQELVS